LPVPVASNKIPAGIPRPRANEWQQRAHVQWHTGRPVRSGFPRRAAHGVPGPRL